MESESMKAINGKNEENTRSGTNESHQVEKSTPIPPSQGNNAHASKVDWKGGDARGGTSHNVDTTGEINMEAEITAGDVIRAGGFGARDDIGSFLPVASDSTDFEASILDAKDYEEPQRETSRPGLGWKEG